MKKGAQVIEDIKKTTSNNKVEVMEMDLTSLESVRNFVKQFQARKLPINILICKCISVLTNLSLIDTSNRQCRNHGMSIHKDDRWFRITIWR